MSEAVYQLNIFGCVYPEKGKKIFVNRKAMYNRLEKYRLRILEKYAKGLRRAEMQDLIQSIDNGYQITKIDALTTPNWVDYFKDGTFVYNPEQKRVRDFDE